MLKCLDLCAGFGGFSEAFHKSPHWEVMRIDNNPLLAGVENMEIIDIFEFRDHLHNMIERGYCPDKVDLIVASPPCHAFSMGWSAPRAVASREGRLEQYQPDMSILEATLDIIKMLNPTYYIIENVKGAIRYFEPYLGEPNQSFKAWHFWGKFPHMNVNVANLPTKASLDKRHSPLRTNYRSVVPYEISMSLLHAIECQTLITYWS